MQMPQELENQQIHGVRTSWLTTPKTSVSGRGCWIGFVNPWSRDALR